VTNYCRSIADKASYRNRGGIFQHLVTAYKARRFLTKSGKHLLIKRSAEFHLTNGADLEIDDNCTIQDYCFFQLTLPSPKVFIGKNTVVGRGSLITAKNLIKIGSNVLIGSFVQIIDHNHGFARDQIIREQRAIIGEVVIGDDVWIGAGAKILINAHIGNGAIIGANAVVTSDIPEYAVAVGVPARVIKYRG